MIGEFVANKPLTTPLVDPTVAHELLLLLQVPPAVASLRPIVEPVQTVFKPVMPAGAGLTVTGAVIAQPVGNV